MNTRDSQYGQLSPARAHDAPVLALSFCGSHFFGSDGGGRNSLPSPITFFGPLIGPGLFFGSSGEANCDATRKGGDATSPSKAHVQMVKARVTSGAQDFENMETSDPDTSSQSDSENHPAKLPRNPYSSATRQACPSIRPTGDKWNEGVAAVVGSTLKLRSVFRFLNSSDSMTRWQEVQALCRAAGFKSYSDYLQSDHWQELKAKRGLDRCCVCEVESGLLGHHKRYRAIVDCTEADIEPMCGTCHEDFHMACRKLRLDYIGMEPAEIKRVVTEFRQESWYKSWIARRERKRLRRAGQPIPQSLIKVPWVPPQVICWIVGTKGGQEFKLTTILMPRKVANKVIGVINKQWKRNGFNFQAQAVNPEPDRYALGAEEL